MSDDLFDRIEEKTSVNKETIARLARKLQSGNFKDENTLKEIISEISAMTGKEVSAEKERKIIEMVQNDQVPQDMEKYV